MNFLIKNTLFFVLTFFFEKEIIKFGYIPSNYVAKKLNDQSKNLKKIFYFEYFINFLFSFEMNISEEIMNIYKDIIIISIIISIFTICVDKISNYIFRFS